MKKRDTWRILGRYAIERRARPRKLAWTSVGTLELGSGCAGARLRRLSRCGRLSRPLRPGAGVVELAPTAAPRARAMLLQPLDDHAVAGLEALVDQPACRRSCAPCCSRRALDLAVRADDHRGRLALRVARDACCGTSDRVLRARPPRRTRARTCRAAARPRDSGTVARSATAPVAWSTVTSVNCSLPVERVRRCRLRARASRCGGVARRSAACRSRRRGAGAAARLLDCVTST